MIQVLVVEDERPTARVIGKLVDQTPGFSVVEIESNGERALRFMRENPVDLVITDIQMPVMDGLELLKNIHQDYPQCLTVLLTGFSQFEYAQTALQYRAFEYLLKPVDSVGLRKTLEKVQSAWQKRHYIQEHALLEQALTGALPETHSSLLYHVMLVQISPQFWSRSEPMQWKENGCHIFNNVLNQTRILAVEESCWHPQAMIAALSDLPVDLIYCTNPVSADAMSQTVQRLQSQLYQQCRLFRSNILNADTTQPLAVRKNNLLREMQAAQAVEAICARDIDALRRGLGHMWQVVLKNGSLRQDVCAYLNAILSDSRICNQLLPAALQQLQTRLHTIVASAADQDICTEQLLQVLPSLLQQTGSKRDAMALAEEVAQYLEANYHLNLTIDTLAKQFGFVPNHLNKVFKTYKGVRPTEYLLNLRIRQARHLLETRPDLMIKDVAASVGYADHHYFSKVFQRATGHWPTEYQNEVQKLQ